MAPGLALDEWAAYYPALGLPQWHSLRKDTHADSVRNALIGHFALYFYTRVAG